MSKDSDSLLAFFFPKKGSTISKSAASSKPKADPLAGILNENRFNVREKGMVKIVSDSMTIKISD